MTQRRKMDDVTRARIVAMAKDGIRPAMIDRAMPSVGLANIYTAISTARKAGVNIPPFPAIRMPRDGRLPRSLSIEVAALKNRPALLAAAKCRGMTETRLVRRLLDVVLRDGMIDAILDDGVNSDAA